MKLIFPSSVLDQHLVLLGKTGSGKSSALRYLAEHLLDQKKRVCIVDPKGDWGGIKINASGVDKSSYPVIGFGDFKNAEAQDVPINQHSGKLVADLVANGNRPCVIGFRGWMISHMVQFWIDFAAGLFNHNQGELYLLADEFHNFAPKGQVKGKEGAMPMSLHWSNRLLSEGRGLGIVCMLASQRPQKVHNDTLTSCETLIAMRVIHAADRTAISSWIDGCGDREQGRAVLDALAGMDRGEAYVWSPEAKYGPVRVRFPMFRTFDSFAPPQLQKKVTSKDWSSVNLNDVKQKMADVIREHEQSDPKALRARITQLEKELAVLKAAPTTPPEPVLTKQDREVIKQLTGLEMARLIPILQRLERAGCPPAIPVMPVSASGVPFCTARVLPSVQAPAAVAKAAASPPKITVAIGDLKISASQQRILDALAFYESIHIPRPTNLQVGVVATLDTTGGHFSNLVGPLSSNGLLVRQDGHMQLTAEGRGLANLPANIGTLTQYHDMLRSRVRRVASNKSVELLDAVISLTGEAGQSATSEDVGAQIRIDHTGGHFSNTIGPLSTLGLIRRSQGQIFSTDILFPNLP